MQVKSIVVNRRSLVYASLVLVMALVLSAGLLQITQTIAQSAPLAPDQVPFRIYPAVTPAVTGTLPTTGWKYQIVPESDEPSQVEIPPGEWLELQLPLGTYTITQQPKEGYWLSKIECGITGQQPLDLQTEKYAVIDLVDVSSSQFNFCTFDNIKYSSVTVVKDAIPDDPQPFDFEVDIKSIVNSGQAVQAADSSVQFALVDDGTAVSNTKTFTGLQSGQAAILSEGYVKGWMPLSFECVDKLGNPQDLSYGPVGAAQVAGLEIDVPQQLRLTIEDGEDYTCTFTNVAPRLELTKTVGTAAGTCATTDEIDVLAGTEVHYCYEAKNTGGVTLTHHTLVDSLLGTKFSDLALELAPGESTDPVFDSATIAVDTTNVATWMGYITYTPKYPLVPNAASVQAVTLVAFPPTELKLEAEATDTARVNVVEPSKIIVDKVTDPVSSTQVFSFAYGAVGDGAPALEFTLTDESPPYEIGDLLPGSYAVSELMVQGWQFADDPVCTDEDGLSYEADAIELPEGVTVTCVFTNEQYGQIIVDKVTTPQSSDQSFDFTLSEGATTVPFSLTDSATPYTSDQLPPGTYVVAEAPVEGWTIVDATCDDGSEVTGIQLDPGESVACEFTNASLPSIVLTKTVGTSSDTCSTEDVISVPQSTVVYYCYTVTNTGDYTLALHSLVDDQLGSLFTDLEADLAPDASASTLDLGRVISATIATTTTNVATWTASISDTSPIDVAALADPVEATATATVNVPDVPTALEEDGQPSMPVHLFLPAVISKPN